MAGNRHEGHNHSCSLESDVSQPSSLADSVQTGDSSNDDFASMAANQKEDVNDVLDDVIVKINRITDHLREAGENEAANRFTQEMTNTLKDLYNIIAPWDIEKCLMKCPQPSVTAAPRGTQPLVIRSNCISTPSPGTTWAAIAATEPIAEKSGIIKFRPSDGLQIKASQQHSDARTNLNDARDHRVVWIRPWTAARPLEEITRKMQNIGSIYSMAYAPEAEAVCIIFQHAACATDFMNRCAQYTAYNGTSLFGADYEIAPGLPYPLTKDLTRMDVPHMERRRLTFARAGLFNKDGVTQQRFKHDIEEIVGSSNVELLWLFNTGNATVVFSAVPLARLVRDTFIEYGRLRSSPYNGIMVSYSHDPCERDMHLVSQIPGHPGYIGGGSVPASGSRPRGNTIGSGGTFGNGGNPYSAPAHKRRITGLSGAKPNLDDDGWQTVKKRR